MARKSLMRPILVLHVGVHRTATTSIQRSLASSRSVLQAQGIHPAFGQGRHAALFDAIFSDSLNVADACRTLIDDARDTGADISTILLSDEDICLRPDLTWLAAFQDTFDVKVVLSLRRQDLWLESWYQQNVKWQWNSSLAHLTFPDFVARREDFFWIDYDRTLTHLEDLFGPQNVICRVFEKDRMPQGPVADFYQAIGQGDLIGQVDLPRDNSRLSPLITELMRVLPLDSLPDPQRNFFERAFSGADDAVQQITGPQSPWLMDHALRARVMAGYAPGNAAVAARILGEGDLFLDPLPPADAPLAPLSLPAGSYETVETLLVPLVRSLAEVWAGDLHHVRHNPA